MDFKRFKFKDFFGGLGFFGMSAFVLVMMSRERPVKNYRTYLFGIETPCSIVDVAETESTDNGINRSASVRYRYEFSRKTHEGRWTPEQDKKHPLSPGEISDIVEAHRPGTTAICHVNPDAPEESALHASFPWDELGFASFVSLFGIFGAYMMLASFGFVPNPQTWGQSQTASRRVGFVIGLLLGGAGFMGLSMFWKNILIRPDPTGWRASPCIVEAASVRTTWHKKRAERNLEVRFAYRYDDKEYRSYNIRPGTPSVSVPNSGGELAVHYATGTRTTCLVNPQNPAQAALEPHPDETGLRVITSLFLGAVGFFGALMALGCAFGKRLGRVRLLQKAGLIFFVTAIGGGLIGGALFSPVLRINGFETTSWYARGAMIVFGAAVGGFILFKSLRDIPRAPEIEEPVSSLGVGPKRPRRKKRRN